MASALERWTREAQWLRTAFDPEWVEDERRSGERMRWMQDAQGWALGTLRAYEAAGIRDAALLKTAREVYAATTSDRPAAAHDALARDAEA